MSILLDQQIYKPKSTVICVFPMHDFYFNQHAIFEKFGKLRFVGIEKRRPNFIRVGLIEFQDDSVATELISKGYMEIEDNKCEIKSYEEFQRTSKLIPATVLKHDCTEGALLQPPKQDSCKHILNVLNDDCLREIFQQLHLSTLMSVVNVCVRFHRVAKEAFSSKYKSKKIHICDLTWDRMPTKSQVNNFLSDFGSSISSLSLQLRNCSRYSRSEKYEEDMHFHLGMISKYCNGLKELEFSCSYVPESTLNEIFLKSKTLFERLRTLRVYYVKCRSFFEIISVCSNLEVLEVFFHSMGEIDPLIPPNSALPKLVEATLNWDIFGHCVFEAIQTFLELNSKLKVLRINGTSDFIRNSFPNLGDLSELKEFDITVDPFNIESIEATLSSPNIQIQNLQVSLRGPGDFFLTYIPTFGNITELRMRDEIPSFDEMFYFLEHTPNLVTFHIKLNNEINTENETIMTIKSILQHAPHSLSKLVFERWHLFIKSDKSPQISFPIDDDEYYDILKSVEDRASGIKLTIQLFFHEILHDEYVSNTQAIYILNAVPKCLIIEQRVGLKQLYFPI